MIRNRKDMLAHLSAETIAQAKRHVYQYTDCGAWIEFTPDGIKLGSIVEGCDFGTAIYPLKFPFSEQDYDDRIKAIEAESSALWTWANEGPEGSDETWADRGLDAPDVDREYQHLNPCGRSA